MSNITITNNDLGNVVYDGSASSGFRDGFFSFCRCCNSFRRKLF